MSHPLDDTFAFLLCVEAFFQYHIIYEKTSTVSHGFHWSIINPRKDTLQERHKFWEWYAKWPHTFAEEFLLTLEQDH